MKNFEGFIKDNEGNQGTVLFERVTGSRMYGTQYEKGEHPFNPQYVSDYDYRGLFIINPLQKLKLSPFNAFSETVKLEDDDTEFYEIEKFFAEAKKNNASYLDLIFGDDDTLVGANDDGRLILDNKSLFLSNKIADSFLGFSNSQLHRIKRHNEWYKKFPNIKDVQDTLTEAYKNNEVDNHILSDLFSGQLAKAITNENPNDKKLISQLNAKEMLDKYFSGKDYDVLKYTKPHALNFITLQSNSGKELPLTESIKHYLINNASFKNVNNNFYFIYDDGAGIFTNDGNIQAKSKVPPNQNNDIKALMFIQSTKFKKAQENIKDLWAWKVNRNPVRSALEERFGYDVKHGMHTNRLLEAAISILEDGEHNTKLTGTKLTDAKDILSGQWEYDYFLNEVDLKQKKLIKLKSMNLIRPEVDYEKISEIYNEIVFKNIRKNF